MKTYQVLYFTQSSMGTLEDELNKKAEQGYELVLIQSDTSFRTYVVLKLKENIKPSRSTKE